jgi:hypothetical protein
LWRTDGCAWLEEDTAECVSCFLLLLVEGMAHLISAVTPSVSDALLIERFFSETVVIQGHESERVGVAGGRCLRVASEGFSFV